MKQKTDVEKRPFVTSVVAPANNILPRKKSVLFSKGFRAKTVSLNCVVVKVSIPISITAGRRSFWKLARSDYLAILCGKPPPMK